MALKRFSPENLLVFHEGHGLRFHEWHGGMRVVRYREPFMQDPETVTKNTGTGGPIVAWVVLLFVLTLLGALPFVIGRLRFAGFSPSTPLARIAFAGLGLIGFAPALAALLIAAFFPGTDGVRSLLRQIPTWRVGVAWYGVALIGPMILALSANVLHIVMGGPPPEHWLALPSLIAFGNNNLFFMIFAMPIGALGEELGWRGFAQPHLQSRYGALTASIIVGVVWSTWHLWYVITPGGFSNVAPIDALATYIRLISTSVLYTWMYNSTKASLFLIAIAHAGHNIAVTLIQSPWRVSHVNHLMLAGSYLASAIVVVLMTDPRTLTPSKVESVSHSVRT
jgi:membrane protease YdiL (CAAX protease family)